MGKEELMTTRKNLFIRGFGQFILTGILLVIIQDKEVLAYFLSLETLLTILSIGVGGGLLYLITTPLFANYAKRFKNRLR